VGKGAQKEGIGGVSDGKMAGEGVGKHIFFGRGKGQKDENAGEALFRGLTL